MDYTQRGLEKIKEPGSYWDPGNPGLVLRVYPTGGRAWWFSYRMGGRAAKKQWLKIGDFSSLPLNRAQGIARSHRVKVENGVDPHEAIKEANTRGMTVAELAADFRGNYMPRKSASTQQSYGAAIDLYILPPLGGEEVVELTKGRIIAWHQSFALPIAANRALATLSSMLTYGIEEKGLALENPCLKVPRNTETPRIRDIEKHELQAIGQACRDLEGQHSLWALAAIRVVLLCWGRVSEVLGLKRGKDTHLDEGYALVRDHKGKRAGAKRLELPPHAVKILKGLPQEKGNPYYFPGRSKGLPLTRNGLHKTWLAVCEKAQVTDLHLHDSRSMAASEAYEQKLDPKTAAAILGHKDQRTTAKHYAKVRKAREGAAAVEAPIAAALGE